MDRLRLRKRLLTACVVVYGVVAFIAAAAVEPARAGELIPRPYTLQPAVRFWTRVYTEVDTSSGFIHDAVYLDVVYDTIRFADDPGSRSIQRQVDARKEVFRRILLDLASGQRNGLDADEQRVLRLWPAGVSSETLRAAAENVRFQLGQADRFREGVVRSGQWETHIRKTLAEYGVPVELAALPHVESSFNPFAVSSVGAAGMWQFMPSTGRRFLRINDVVDERLDPWKSSEAAAKYLSENYRVTGAWPLAITGYNHGAGGMRKAAQSLGTKDIAVIVRRWKGANFGFASRNFYASFLAASDVSKNPGKYFGGIAKLPAQEPRTIVLERSYSVGTLQRTLGVDLDALREHNLALRSSFWAGSRYAPVGYALRIPRAAARDDVVDQLAATPADVAPRRVTTAPTKNPKAGARTPKAGKTVAAAKTPTEKNATAKSPAATKNLASSSAKKTSDAKATPGVASYRVRRGDTAADIARRFGVSQSELLSANGISNPKQLRPGQVLRLPGRTSPRAADARTSSLSDEA